MYPAMRTTKKAAMGFIFITLLIDVLGSQRRDKRQSVMFAEYCPNSVEM